MLMLGLKAPGRLPQKSLREKPSSPYYRTSIFPWGGGCEKARINHLDWERNRSSRSFGTREQDEPLHADRERYPLGAYDVTTIILQQACGYGGSFAGATSGV